MVKQHINKETGFPIAQNPEEMPPLRDGYIRLIHQTSSTCQESFIENGLIYNRDYAGVKGYSHYTDIDSMAIPHSEESFWERLTHEEVRHRGSDSIAVFDMPAEEYHAHKFCEIAGRLNGTISSGYLVGFLPNYGTKDGLVTQKLSQEEMEEKRSLAKHNTLPPEYETPNWKENVQKAIDEIRLYNLKTKKKYMDGNYFPPPIIICDHSNRFSFIKHTKNKVTFMEGEKKISITREIPHKNNDLVIVETFDIDGTPRVKFAYDEENNLYMAKNLKNGKIGSNSPKHSYQPIPDSSVSRHLKRIELSKNLCETMSYLQPEQFLTNDISLEISENKVTFLEDDKKISVSKGNFLDFKDCMIVETFDTDGTPRVKFAYDKEKDLYIAQNQKNGKIGSNSPKHSYQPIPDSSVSRHLKRIELAKALLQEYKQSRQQENNQQLFVNNGKSR